ncbi:MULTISPECIES: pseudouridine synthase [unclassified Halomonas]|uniref:pseudouridine synthase n=1 Tax=unclassified Halomonas TaxID=2609666 RepID=UPI0005FA2EA0|nr:MULTISPECIES: pseudouridine synthase [unclassified Halomonas]KJZ14058.1 pseudouridine synthase [Halomonas sp. S2151]MAR73227.1 pseudouridine synthase [Halomonas sp.]MBS8269126.1 pseudouridine synthase [Halomonas litopenaei]MCO7214189.1 pseudouridine synthase [Halomonas sp. OfavH-34-E]
MSQLYLLHKPYRVLSQFTDDQGRNTLASLIDVPDIYPAGRLDYDSEGLLLLSDDGELIHRISHPRHKQPKTYRVLVEGQPDDRALKALAEGVTLNDGPTRPAKVRRLTTSGLPERTPPLDPKRHPVTCWLELTISEGRNRQVRRMTAHVGHPTLRLVRVAIGPWRLDGLAPGQWQRQTLHAPKRPRGSAPTTRRRR